MQKQIPLTFNTSEKDITSQQELVNVYPSPTDGGKYQYKLVNTPGLAYFTELPTFPVLGLLSSKGQAFAVTPSKFYEIFKDGSYNELGDVEFSGNVSIATNGNQVVAVDGKNAYYYDIEAATVKKITDSAFYPSNTVTYQDGYFIFTRNDTGQFFISGLFSLSFNALEYATAEGHPDPLVAVISSHRELFLFGTETTEVWYNSGAGDFPFERNQGVFIEKGCAAPLSVRSLNNTVFFIGSDLIVYKVSNYYSTERVSNHAVEKYLSGVDLSDAFAYTYNNDGHLFYVLTIPKRNITWCYDITTRAWHIRRGYNVGRHRSNNAMYFDNKTLVGDCINGKIYELSSTYYMDYNDPIVRVFVLPTFNTGRERVTLDSFELDLSSGVGLAFGQGDNPELRVYHSRDNGITYGDNFKRARIGKMGKYLTRAKVNRFGVGRQFTFKIQISDPIPISVGGAWVEIR